VVNWYFAPGAALVVIGTALFWTLVTAVGLAFAQDQRND
jgi:hypothetical protein